MGRMNIAGTSPYEATVGYARAVRVGPLIAVAGTTATDAAGQLVGLGDPYAQTHQILENIGRALAQAGASHADVVRTRIFVTDIADWEAVGRAHGEIYASVRPATTLVEVSKLIDARMLVEIEADAFVWPDV